jgi:hypothetical protein
MTRDVPRTRTLALATAAAALALLAVGAPAASAAPAATEKATTACWKQVVNDWLQHQPNLAGTYPIPCYTQAIQNLSNYPDIKQYSSAIDDIHRALLAALRQGSGGGGPPSSGSQGGGGGGGNSSGGSGKALLPRIFDRIAPGNAQSIPLPLLVLGGLAVLLLLTAGGTWLTRRLQARRITPAPAPAPSTRRPG